MSDRQTFLKQVFQVGVGVLALNKIPSLALEGQAAPMAPVVEVAPVLTVAPLTAVSYSVMASAWARSGTEITSFILDQERKRSPDMGVNNKELGL